MATYSFDWTDIVQGTIEIEASSSKDAEKIFRELSLSERLNRSDLDSEKSSLKIRFVDVGLGDIQTEPGDFMTCLRDGWMVGASIGKYALRGK